MTVQEIRDERRNSGPLGGNVDNLEAENPLLQALALPFGDFNMGSFIFHGPFNSALKARLLSQKDEFESALLTASCLVIVPEFLQ